MDDSKLWNRHFVAVCLSSFFLFMTFYILAVTLPVFVTDALHQGKNQIGPVMTVFIISTVIFRPLTGKWLEEVNRKKLVMFALVLFAVCAAGYLFVHQYGLLLALRFIHGIGFGIATTATGAIAVDLVPDRRKGEGIGYFSLFMSLAMVIGPFIGLTVIAHFSYTVLFVLCFAFTVLSVLFGAIVRIPERAVQPSTQTVQGWRKLIEPGAIPISLTGSMLAFSYGAITTFLSVYANDIGLGPVSSYFFMVFAAMIVLSRPFTGKLFDRSGAHVLVYPGLVLFTAGMLALSGAHSAFVFLAAGAVLGLGYGALLPSYQTLAVQAAPPHRRGLATATYFLLFDAGYGIGSSVLGIVASHTSYREMYFIAGLVVVLSTALYYTLHHRREAVLNARPRPGE
ncbi:MFS transporter [Paenibacillus hamazuiensis]|uniref:MFS transporter n=1 Tax=Paenibacillus hamazuiensis TaxID=2936508 RepID=UPI00200E566F